MKKIRVIVAKEWSEVFKNRLVLFTVAFLPLLLTAIPVVMLVVMERAGPIPASELEEVPDAVLGTFCAGIADPNVCMQVYLLNIFTLMFMILPVAIPVTIAAYSIVGEKSNRSLEPLLATPLTTGELIAAKALSAIIPAIVATWLAFGIYVGLIGLIADPAVFRSATQPVWLLAIFLDGPLLTLMAVGVAMIISSRVNDPRVAEQLSTVVILPLILMVVGQALNLFLIDQALILWAALFLVALDAGLLYLAVRLFQRETILTRWH